MTILKKSYQTPAADPRRTTIAQKLAPLIEQRGLTKFLVTIGQMTIKGRRQLRRLHGAVLKAVEKLKPLREALKERVQRATGEKRAGARVPRIVVGPRRRAVLIVVACAFGQAAAAGLAAYATRGVFSELHSGATQPPWTSVGLLLISGVLLAGARVFGRSEAERLGLDYAAELRAALFERLSRSAAADVAALRQGAITIRFVGDLRAIRGWVSQGFTRLVATAIILPLAAVSFYLIQPVMATFVAPVIALGLIGTALLAPRLEPLHREARRRAFRLGATMMERGPMAPELNAIGRMRREQRSLRAQSEKLSAASVRRATAAALLRATPDLTGAIASATLVLTAFAYSVPGADLAAALALLALLITPLRDLAGVWDRHRAWRVARERCEAFMKESATPRGGRGPVRTGPASAVFHHAIARNGLTIDATATPGRRIAVTGPSGSGKSLLLALINGLERPAAGAVMIDGVEPMVAAAREIRLVGPRSPLLRGSLRRAVTLGAPQRPHDDLILSLGADFGLTPLLDRLGLDGRVSERGANLSRGEVARLILLRAHLSKPRLLLIDDFGLYDDPDFQRALNTAIARSSATTLVAMRRIQDAAIFDEEWRIQDGRVDSRAPTARTQSPDAAPDPRNMSRQVE